MRNRINEKTIDGVVYTAYRDSENPKKTKVVIVNWEEETVEYPENFGLYRANLK